MYGKVTTSEKGSPQHSRAQPKHMFIEMKYLLFLVGHVHINEVPAILVGVCEV